MARVFISYRQLNDPQKLRRVREFAEQLRRCGIEVILDQFYLEENPAGPARKWPFWCSNHAKKAKRVLIIGDAPWFRSFDGKETSGDGLGAACEAASIRDRIYNNNSRNNFARVAYFDKGDLDEISDELKNLQHFHVEGDFPALIKWLGGTMPVVGVQPEDPPLVWPAPPADFSLNMANRVKEFNFFKETLTETASKRATFFSAASNYGKTKLVAECKRYGGMVFGVKSCSLVDCKPNGTLPALWESLIIDLGDRFPELNDRDPAHLRKRLRELRKPVLIMIDAYENATEEARHFVERTLLAELSPNSALRMVVAGQPQAMTDPGKYAWQDHAHQFELEGITEQEPWVRWASQFYSHMPPDFVRSVVLTGRGVPGDIANQIKLFSTYTMEEFKAQGFQYS